MHIKHAAPWALAALLATGIAGAAYAEGSNANSDARDATAQDFTMLAGMKVTLPQAIAVAERQAGGRAVSADASQENGSARIEVEVAGPHGTKTVLVDGQTGQATTAQAESQDNGQDGESND